MPDLAALSALAAQVNVDFTGPVRHATVVALARAWLPDLHFHEEERFHTLDLAELYSVPAEEFERLDELTRQDFDLPIAGVQATPPVVRVGDTLRGEGTAARDALLAADVDANAVVTHGGNLRAADKFFASAGTLDGTPVPGFGNPRLPRRPLRVRAELRMLLETQKQTLALAERGIEEPVDAIWGDFDVTDLLLRRAGGGLGAPSEPASREVRHTYARDLIREHEKGHFEAVERLLQSPPNDGLARTRADRTVWQALTTCALLEYYFVYGYSDFARYGGIFANEHEGDVEGCCVVFERQRLAQLEEEENGDPASVPPLAIITIVHNPSNRADEPRGFRGEVASEIRGGLDVFIARGSHATYLSAEEHDFFDITDLLGEDAGSAALIVVSNHFPLLIPLLMAWEHFNGDPDVTSEHGVTGQSQVDPDNPRALPVEVVVTPLSRLDDASVYDLSRPGGDHELALRAFRGRLGNHDGIVDKSPTWENRTRRYFPTLVALLASGEARPPLPVT